MADEEQKAWDTWTEYCRKLKLYYDATDVTVTEQPELGLWGMSPPTEQIVDGTLFADSEIYRLQKAIVHFDFCGICYDGTFCDQEYKNIVLTARGAIERRMNGEKINGRY